MESKKIPGSAGIQTQDLMNTRRRA